MLYKHISGSSLGGNVMTQEQSILKEMPYLYLMSLWIWRNVTKYIYTWSKKWKYFIADNILGKEEFFDEKETGKVIIEAFNGKTAEDIHGVVVFSHGPFAW